jgi:hypothetical protein
MSAALPSGRNRRNRKLAIVDRRRRVSAFYLQGKSQAEIAKDLGVVISTVCKDLKAIQAEWRASTTTDFNAARAKELAAIDALQRAHWDAWEKSRGDVEVMTVRTGMDNRGPYDERQIRTHKSVGNPAHLLGVHACMEKRSKILGLYAPERLEHSGAVDGTVWNLTKLTDEEIETLATIRDKSRRTK